MGPSLQRKRVERHGRSAWGSVRRSGNGKPLQDQELHRRNELERDNPELAKTLKQEAMRAA